MQDASGTTTYDYDLRGLLTGEERTIQSETYTTTYQYDKNGNLTDLFYPQAAFVGRQGRAQYVYNQANQVTTANAEIAGGLTSVATNLAYEPFGPLAGLTFANGLVESRTYDTRYQLLNLSLGALLSFTHSYDDDGDLDGRVDNLDAGNNLTFAYDELHRLATAVGPWGPGNLCPGGVTYTYDKNGNRTCKGEVGSATTYTHLAGTNQLDASAGGTVATFAHDAHGNVTDDGTHTYDFDDANRLEIVDAGPSETTRYTYDGDNRRTTKLASGTTTLYFYTPDGQLISEVIPGTASGQEYVYLNEMLVARVDWSAETSLGNNVLFVAKSDPNVQLDWSSFPVGSNDYVVRRKKFDALKTFSNNTVIATVTDPQQTHDDPVLNDGQSYFYRVFREEAQESLYFYHVDHLGTPEAMTNGAGTLVWQAQHLPFGEILTPTVETVTNNVRLPGQYFDAETGLFQNWHRDYDPGLGRYREPDPLGVLKDPQLYPYVGNNPTNWVDVLGLYRRGDVIYRVDPKSPDSADVTFVWDDPTPDIDGNGDEIILAFGNPEDCPDTCSDKARMLQIDSDADPYKGWKITGDWKPGWWSRSSNGTYQRRWRRWQRQNPSWTPPAELDRGVKGVQCYNLVNAMTGKGDRMGFDNIFDLRAPRDLRYWRRKTER